MKYLRYLIPLVVLIGIVMHFASGNAPGQRDTKHNIQSGKSGNQTALQKRASAKPHPGSLASGGNESTAPTGLQSTGEELGQLTDSEQKSLRAALSEARREIRPIPGAWSQREENIGYDFYSLHPRQNLTTRFGDQGVQIDSSNRTYTGEDAQNPTTSWSARINVLSLAGKDIPPGASAQKAEGSGSRVEYRHSAGLTEWYENGTTAMEHGYTVSQRPAHLDPGENVVIEVALGGLKAMPHTAEDGSYRLDFAKNDRTVLSYSKLLVVDAHGKELPATMKPTDSGFQVAYNDAQAAYPVTVDPLIVNEEAKLVVEDAEEFDSIGSSISISGDTVVVGSPRDDDAGSSSGSAYVFTRSGTSWSLQAKLTADDAEGDDSFGESVSVSGDFIVAGADGDDEGGSAYVFIRSGTSWSQQAKLTSDDAESADSFGYSVSISGDSIVVGAFTEDERGLDSGSAYVFTRSGTLWMQQDKLTANDGAEFAYFGSSVAISGDTIVAGAVFDGDGGSQTGSAYVFTRSGSSWAQQDKLTADDAAENDRFGYSVAISGDSVVVGAYNDDDDGTSSGSAYVFTRSGTSWPQKAKLTAGDAAQGDKFGYSVAISGDSIVVGAYDDDGSSTSTGSAYLFTRTGTTWAQRDKLTADDAAEDDRFGNSVAISGDSVVASATGDDEGASSTGSVYIYRFAIPSERQLQVFDSFGTQITTNTAAPAFPVQQLGTSLAHTFRLTNAGELDLDLQSISLGGANSNQFGIAAPDISSTADLATGQSLDLTITFSPSGSSNGLRNGTITIASNDSNTPSFSFDITGFGLSNTTDGDGDGMNDFAEYSLRGFGFDWEKSQPAMVNGYYDSASAAGLFTRSEAAAVTGAAVLSDVDLTTNTAVFTISLGESLSLLNFTPLTIDPNKLSVDGSGNIRYELTAPAGKKFYHAGFVEGTLTPLD